MVKAILFDLGDTITLGGFSKEGKKKMDALLRPYGFDWDGFFPYWRSFYILRSLGRIRSDKEMAAWTRRVLQKDIPLEEVIDNFIKFQRIPRDHIKIIRELKKNYKIYLFTNYVQEWVKKILKKYKIDSLFDGLIVSSEFGVRKPNPIIYQEMLKTASEDPEEMVFVSDELGDDLIIATAVGIKTIWLNVGLKERWWKKKDRELLKIYKPDAVVKNFREIIPAIQRICPKKGLK